MSEDSTHSGAAVDSDGDRDGEVDEEFAQGVSLLLAAGFVLFLVLPCLVVVGGGILWFVVA